jgi:hypothetical protein
MRPTSKDLAMRDPALAAALGITPGADFGADYGSDYGFGADYGDSMGFGFGADAPAAAPVPRPNPQQMMALWQQHHAMQAKSAHRASILSPNKGSDVKVGRYSFSVNQSLVIGTAAAITASQSPDTNIRPQRVTANAPSVGFALVSEIKAANVSVLVGGLTDAFDFNPQGVGQSLDMPTITPSNKVTVLGNYTGIIPAPFVAGNPFTFVVSFKGPASVTPEDT